MNNSFYVISTVRGISIGLFAPLWILFLYSEGYSLLEIGIIGTIFEVCKFIFEIPSGSLADKFGIKSNIIISFILLMITWTLFIFSENIIILGIVLLCWALSESLFSGTFESWISIKVNKLEFSKVLFNTSKFLIFGAVIMSLFSGYLYSLNPKIPFLIVSVLLFVLILYLFNIEIPKKNLKNAEKNETIKDIIKSSAFKILKNVRVRNIVVASFFFAFVIDTIDRYWQPYFIEIEIKEIYFGLITSIGGTILFIVLHIFSKFSDKIDKNPEKYSLFFSILTAILISFLLIKRKIIVFFSTALVTTIDDILNNIINSIINKEIKSDNMATVFSLNGASVALAEILSGVFFGWIAQQLGLYTTFIVCLIFLIPTILLYFKNFMYSKYRS